MSEIIPTFMVPHGVAVFAADFDGDDLTLSLLRTTGEAVSRVSSDPIKIYVEHGYPCLDDILQDAALHLSRTFPPIDGIQLDFLVVSELDRTIMTDLSEFQLTTLRPILFHEINFLALATDESEICAITNGAAAPIAIYLRPDDTAEILSPFPIIGTDPQNDHITTGPEDAPWSFVPLRITHEWRGHAPAGLGSWSIDGFIAGCATNDLRTDDPCTEVNQKIVDWLWNVLSPSLADPFTDHTMDVTQSNSQAAPMTFVGASEREIAALIRAAVILDFSADEEEVDFEQSE